MIVYVGLCQRPGDRTLAYDIDENHGHKYMIPPCGSDGCLCLCYEKVKEPCVYSKTTGNVNIESDHFQTKRTSL